MVACIALELLVIKWFTEQGNPQFELNSDQVAQYITAPFFSVHAEQVKEKLCEELGASLLHAPTSIFERLGTGDVQDSQIFIVIMILIVNGILPRDELCSRIFGIFLKLEGLTNSLLESGEESAEIFRVNFQRLGDKVTSGHMLETMIKEWFTKREAPKLKVPMADITAYITKTFDLAGAQISEDYLVELLNDKIAYAPTGLVREIINRKESCDPECVTLVVKLLIKGFLPPHELCAPILRIFSEGDGRHLTDFLLQSQTPVSAALAESLQKMSRLARENILMYTAARQESGHLLRQIESLPIEIIDLIIENAVFSGPSGSHDAVHTIRAFSQEEMHPKFAQRVCSVARSFSTKRRVHDDWKIHDNLAHFLECTENRHCTDEQDSAELASWIPQHCPMCMRFLISSSVIHASSFNYEGKGLLLKAHLARSVETGAYIISSMDFDQLFVPISNHQSLKNITTIVASTWRAEWFWICWDRIKTDPELNLSWYGPCGVHNIFQLIDVELVEDLRRHGLDLGEHADSSGWNLLLGRDDAGKIWDWLTEHGHHPPEDFLTTVTMSGNIHNLQWALCHTQSYQDWLNAAHFAASQLHLRSVELLELILHHLHARAATDENLLEGLAMDIVRAACQSRSMWVGINSEEGFQPFTEGTAECDNVFSAVEEAAIRKIRIISTIGDTFEVSGLKVMSKEAGFKRIAESLEELGRENRQVVV